MKLKGFDIWPPALNTFGCPGMKLLEEAWGSPHSKWNYKSGIEKITLRGGWILPDIYI